MKRPTLIALAVALAAGVTLAAPAVPAVGVGVGVGVAGIDPVTMLGRGVNLGNTLAAPNFEGEWGFVIEDRHLELIADAGFDSVRLPVRWTRIRVIQLLSTCNRPSLIGSII